MKKIHSSGSRAVLALLLCLALAACEQPQQAEQKLAPVAFHPADECHVCGMIIAEFPGPKGEAVEKGGVRKFCSTAEMLGWWLQPENQLLDAKLYVHDMTHGDWNQPSDAHLIDARSAWYVTGVNLKGAMGAVLASFADESAARRLAAEQGGRVLRFEDIDQQVLQQAADTQHQASEHAQGHAGH